MKIARKLTALVLCVILMFSLSACRIVIDGESGTSNAKVNGSIGLSVSTQNNPFFVTLADGAKAKAAELGVDLQIADAGDVVTKQVSDIEDLVSKGISVLIVNPCDSDAVTGAVEAAKAKGVKVISVDRAVNGTEIDCQIASDNVAGAELATQYIVDTLGEGAVTAELQGTPGASAAIDRGTGFHNIADKKLTAAGSQTANFNRTEGMTVMENMLQANPDIQAVFAANDEMALGAVEAVNGAGKDVMVVGFDATDDAIEAIKAGKMAATIAQQPDLIGAAAVENAVKLINGETIPTAIPVEVTLVTRDNVEEFGAAEPTADMGVIGLSVSTQNNPFFVTLADGAKAKAAELGVELQIADAGDVITKQVSDIEDLVAKGVKVLIVNPCDSDAVTGAVKAAMDKGVKVIAVDRAVNGVEIDCQIASDNVAGAELATQYIVDTLGEGIVAAELQGTPGASAAIDRGTGFHNIADSKLEVAASQTANFNRTEGMTVMENMLQANPDIRAVFAANDEMALGAVEAVNGAGKDVMVVGFDATDDAIEAIKAGKMAATIAQQPDLIGATSVENAVKLMSGETIPASIPVEVTLITKDNVNDIGAKEDLSDLGIIGLSISTQNNPFFVTLAEGARSMAAEYGVELQIADAGDVITKQVSDIEDLVAKGVKVLIVNPCDSDAVTGAVKAAMDKGVKVIAVDRAVNGVDIDCQIASDNVAGAELATQYIVDALGEGTVVAELQGTPGASAAIDRGTGFHNIADAVLKVAASQTANFNRTEGMTVMENMLQANSDIRAVFAANDEMALGAVEAVSCAGKDVLVVGFDATDDAIEAIKAGRMAATIAQQPDLIGATSVENAIKLMKGESIPKSIPVDVTLITKENAG